MTLWSCLDCTIHPSGEDIINTIACRQLPGKTNYATGLKFLSLKEQRSEPGSGQGVGVGFREWEVGLEIPRRA